MRSGTMVSVKIFKKRETIVSRFIAGETILVPIRGNLADMEKIFSLEQVGEFIWQQLDGKQDLSDICIRIADVFDVDQETAEADLDAFITELQAADLIVEVR